MTGKIGRCKVSAVRFISPEDMKRWDMEAAPRLKGLRMLIAHVTIVNIKVTFCSSQHSPTARWEATAMPYKQGDDNTGGGAGNRSATTHSVPSDICNA